MVKVGAILSVWTLALLIDLENARAADPVLDPKPAVLQGAAGAIHALAISDDGKLLASAGYDVPEGVSRRRAIRLWNLQTKLQVRLIEADCNDVHAIAFSPDGSRLAIGDRDGTVACWNVRTGDLLFRTSATEAETNAVAFISSGKAILAGSDTYYVFDCPSGRKLAETQTTDGWAINALATSWDRKLMVAAYGGEGAILNAANMQTLHVLRRHQRSVDAIAISKDKKRVATGCYDGTIKIWNATTGKELSTIEPSSADGISSLAFLRHDECLASGCADGKIRIWNVATGRIEQVIDASTQAIDALAVSPDGSMLINNDVIRLQVRTLRATAPRLTPHDLNSLDQWEVIRGNWKQEGGHLVASGNSRIQSKRIFPNDRVLSVAVCEVFRQTS